MTNELKGHRLLERLEEAHMITPDPTRPGRVLTARSDYMGHAQRLMTEFDYRLLPEEYLFEPKGRPVCYMTSFASPGGVFPQRVDLIFIANGEDRIKKGLLYYEGSLLRSFVPVGRSPFIMNADKLSNERWDLQQLFLGSHGEGATSFFAPVFAGSPFFRD